MAWCFADPLGLEASPVLELTLDERHGPLVPTIAIIGPGRGSRLGAGPRAVVQLGSLPALVAPPPVGIGSSIGLPGVSPAPAVVRRRLVGRRSFGTPG